MPSDPQQGFLAEYVAALQHLRPGETGEASLEAWMSTRSARWRLRTAARQLGMDLDFGKSTKPRTLVFRAKELDGDSPPPPRREIGPPPKKSRPQSPARRRSYTFDLKPYEELLDASKPGDLLEVPLGSANPSVVIYRMNLVAKRRGLRLRPQEPVGGVLPVAVQAR